MERGDLHHRRGEVARAQRAAGDADRNADRARIVCGAQRGVPAYRADRQARRPARRRPDFRQLHLRRIRRPHRRCDDLLRADLVDQRDDVDRATRHDDDGRGHAGAAAVRPKVDRRRAALRHSVSACSREPAAVYAQLRGGARIHPVRAIVLLVLYRARRDQAAHHASRPAAALPRLGIPGNPCGFPARDRLHDVLSFDGTAVALVPWSFDHVFRSLDLRCLPQAGRSSSRGRSRVANEHAAFPANGDACCCDAVCGGASCSCPNCIR